MAGWDLPRPIGTNRSRLHNPPPLVSLHKVKGKVGVMAKTRFPNLVPLRYGEVHCELCKRTITAGARVGWWKVRDDRGPTVPKSRRWRSRTTAYCADCHHSNIKQRAALR